MLKPRDMFLTIRGKIALVTVYHDYIGHDGRIHRQECAHYSAIAPTGEKAARAIRKAKTTKLSFCGWAASHRWVERLEKKKEANNA